MTGSVRQSAVARGLFALLLSLVLFSRLAAPAGFMPMQSATGVVISLCTGDGAINVVVDRGDTPAAPDSQAQQHCVFAMSTGGALLPPWSPAVATPFFSAVVAVLGAAVADLTVHRLAAPPPPSRGPPAPR